MFDWHGSLIDPRQNRVHLFAVVLLVGLAQSGSPCGAVETASVHVQAALQSEINLDADKRAKLIEAALRVDPKSAEAHWARGEVRMRGQWLSLEDSADEALAQPNLLKYWERRAEAGNTVAEQVRLAEYCRSNRMPAQERAHWAAVIALDSNHREARRRLGQVNVDGVWIDRHQFEEQKKKDLATAVYLQKHADRLMALSIALHDKSKSEERVLKELSEFRNPMVIPGLEYLFSSTGKSGALCTVETVAALAAPEASLSLARHALEFPNESVRTRATEYLKKRDEISFVPALLGALQTPVTKVDDFAFTNNNQIVWRQKILFETQDAKKIATFDRVLQFPPALVAQAAFNPRWAQSAVWRANDELESVNADIEKNNQNIMQLLEATTGEQSPQDAPTKKTTEEWWNWWNDRIESYPADEKVVEYRYESSYQTVSLPKSPPVPVIRAPYECLAAGTPIWTETGLVAIDLLKVGDLVLTQNQRTGELKFAPVLATTTRPPELLLRLTINNETVRATGGHPFWVTGKGWIKARSLERGMGLHTARGFAVIDAINEELEPAETYNLIVDDCHSYFVGKNLILSHDNSACEPVANRIPGLR